MQVLDSLIDGPLQLGNRREGDELIGMIVRYLRTGDEPSPRTDAQRMALAMVRPVLEKSRSRIVAGSKGGSEQQSRSASKSPSKPRSKTESKSGSEREGESQSKDESKRASDIYSSSSIPLSSSEEGVQGEDDGIPYAEIVSLLNGAAGTAYRPTSRKTRSLIRARWASGYRLDDFEAVVRVKCAQWLGDARMGGFLRPETLFGPKFEGYREEARMAGGKEDEHDEYSAL